LRQKSSLDDPTVVRKVGRVRYFLARTFQDHSAVKKSTFNGQSFLCIQNTKKQCSVLFKANEKYKNPEKVPAQGLPLDPFNGIVIKYGQEITNNTDSNVDERTEGQKSQYKELFKKLKELKSAVGSQKKQRLTLFAFTVIARILLHVVPLLMLGVSAPSILTIVGYIVLNLDYVASDYVSCSVYSNKLNASSRVKTTIITFTWMIFFTIPEVFLETSIFHYHWSVILISVAIMLVPSICSYMLWKPLDQKVAEVQSLENQIKENLTTIDSCENASYLDFSQKFNESHKRCLGQEKGTENSDRKTLSIV
jgi:hypothetical protein